MLNIISYQGNVNQNHSEIPLQTHQGGYNNNFFKKTDNNKCWPGCGEIGTLMYCWLERKTVQALWKMV